MDKHTLLSEIRYAERLCQRTARLYRHINAAGVFIGIIGGSGVVSAAVSASPGWLAIAGAITLAISGAVSLAMNPLEKAAIADADGKRYSHLRTQARGMTETELQTALNKLREHDTPEVEALRDVSYNDMVQEIGRPDAAIPLRLSQKLIRSIA
jgi:hypothetical protein